MSCVFAGASENSEPTLAAARIAKTARSSSYRTRGYYHAAPDLTIAPRYGFAISVIQLTTTVVDGSERLAVGVNTINV